MMADVPTYEPIVPTVEADSICSHIFTRAYAEPFGWKRQPHKREDAPLPSLDRAVLVFDTETVKHQLTFGVALFFENRRCKERAVFYRDDLAVTDTDGYADLGEICEQIRSRVRASNSSNSNGSSKMVYGRRASMGGSSRATTSSTTSAGSPTRGRRRR
jgi:hypothetical protein